MFKNINKSSGQVARLLLVLAIIVLVAVIIVYLVMRMAEPAPKPPQPSSSSGGVVQPVYEQTLGNLRFVFESARDMGNALKASAVTNPTYNSYQKDLTTTEKFIEVQMGAQNVGKENIEERSWDLGNIVDSEGREFEPDGGYMVDPWLPNPNLCGTLLKPAFDPTPCVKIYEVSKKSSGLKITVITGKDNSSNNLSSKKIDSALIDLIVTQ